ncbi:MAG: DNA-directed DNA polymerase [Candidatus Hadarchaeales archaeon]
MRGILLDVDFAEEEESPVIRLVVKEGHRKTILLDPSFSHYFYAVGDDAEKLARLISRAEGESRGRRVAPGSAEVVRRTVSGREIEAVKVVLSHPRDMQAIRHAVRELPGVASLYEFDIQPHRSYLLDRGLVPMEGVEADVDVRENGEVRIARAVSSPRHSKGVEAHLRVMSFDIEVYNPGGSPRVDRDPIIMISLSDDGGFRRVLTWKRFEGAPEYVECLGSEREMVERFVSIVRERDPDVLLGYNTDMFDFPYLRERARILKAKLPLGIDGSEVTFRRHRFASSARVRGRIHVDVFSMVEFMATIGYMRLIHYTLEDVYRHLLGKEKPDFEFKEMPEAWDKGGEKLLRLIEYSMSDADATLELGLALLPLFVELARVVGQTLFDVTRMTPGQLVEWLLISEARKRGELVPPRPVGEEFEERLEETYIGGYVMEPVRGLHEKLAVFDFRSLYPSIIVTHNIDPSTLNCGCCAEDERTKVPGMEYWFCTKREGFIPATLKKLIRARFRLKEELKRHRPETEEYSSLNARQTAYKIIANSAYGMLGYSRARWYSKECAESITSFGRHYIQRTIEMARSFGFDVIYSDTDSSFVRLNHLGKEDAMKFLKKVNETLPGIIELELEGFYPRGVFITKKRYAMIDEEGRMVVKGLEFVRRDWAAIAKRTQEEVLRAILNEGSPQRAAEIIKKVTRDIQEGKVKLEDLIIYTQLKMPIESYRSIGPHVVAAKRLRSLGYQVEPGMMIAYVVVRGPGSISERSYPLEMLRNREPDPDYYISNQVLPAVMRIMEVLGYREEDLRYMREKQAGLERFMR